METETKEYFTIKEVAARLNETEPTLRYWESEFQDTITPRRNERGVRFYTKKDIKDVELVQYHLRDLGLTHDGARKKLKNDKPASLKQMKAVQHLRTIKAELKALATALGEAEKLAN
ncbi:MAG: MerR family transcriptional regulator [Tannerella sp.]|jgi:DNA-binding transcriptional MerR regulator|nr:MerR family transcriptional regulator [Tannerella sp.]